ncbi:hypothetical protein ONS95_014851 [Cadophora gregata]|uniref:uncharacterized protein n=1 Tax=Cadophora gregata TaxID=51156 RepID=UPI0026DC5538|nr:uncharacterized protein ONS95_014851 [Cadophora gregata]KAK0113152.1 hypothetical protein ONS95_014851 [Cadophora gregata]KAK0125193.1 hypothetical protein ONS96_009052 [Cadophora gregata f. sp. sojae]
MPESTNRPTVSSPRFNQCGPIDPHPAYICTICWQRQARGSQCKLLGSSARIVCKPCWRTVLDLSICWVCGECIVRGDEVVSLGWCFWHRGCFGCLICGTRLDVPATVASSIGNESEERGTNNTEDWGRRDGDGSFAAEKQGRRFIGVELEEIPLCNVCEIEAAGESTDRVLQKGLETVTRLDGGLSCNRLDMLSEAKIPRIKSNAVRTEESSRSSLCRSHCHNIDPANGEDMSSLLENAAEMGISDNSCIDGSSSHDDGELYDLESTQTFPDEEKAGRVVYVSVLDPVSEPAFRPSKTKPLPKWMALLPSNVHREHDRRSEFVAESTRQSLEMEQMSGLYGCGSNGLDDIDADMPVPGSWAAAATRNGKQQEANYKTSEVTLIQEPPTTASDPKPKGDAVVFPSQIVDLDISTAEISSYYPTSQPQKPYLRSPSSSPSRPSVARDEASRAFSDRRSAVVVDKSMSESCCTLKSQRTASGSYQAIHPIESASSTPDMGFEFSPPSRSSEYQKRYHPNTSVDTRCGNYVTGEVEHILQKIKRQKTVFRDNEEDKEESTDDKGKGKGKELPNWDFGLDPRREDLNKELRNLFCEE